MISISVVDVFLTPSVEVISLKSADDQLLLLLLLLSQLMLL